MEYRASKRMAVLCALGLGAFLLTACGGRFRTIYEVTDEEGGAGSGGRGGAANVGKAGAGSSLGGHPSAGQGQGGTIGISGAPTIAGAPANAGAPSTGSAGSAGSCGAIACPIQVCPPGYIRALPQGSCCSICVQDPASCMKGQQSYFTERAAIADKASYGCSKNTECTVVVLNNQCEQGCSQAAVFYGSADYYTSSLEFAAEQYCQACPGQPEPPCVAPSAAYCVNSQCYLGK